MSQISNEQLAHDLAVAVVSAQLSKEDNVSAGISVQCVFEQSFLASVQLLKTLHQLCSVGGRIK